MRGKEIWGIHVENSRRITPAYAGKSRLVQLQHLPCMGSPPPMRGKGRFHLVRRKLFRITPAYAGKSKIFVINEVGGWDHPRLCGEKRKCRKIGVLSLGSPPPMRGKVQFYHKTTPFIGITPAYAGKSARLLQCQGSSRDHPRLCGEKSFTPLCESLYIGSPPPMRGKVAVCGDLCNYERITPAYAGKRRATPKNVLLLRDHPRLCGEKLTIRSRQITFAGSPPPMRGKGVEQQKSRLLIRIAPAYAGKRWNKEIL